MRSFLLTFAVVAGATLAANAVQAAPVALLPTPVAAAQSVSTIGDGTTATTANPIEQVRYRRHRHHRRYDRR